MPDPILVGSIDVVQRLSLSINRPPPPRPCDPTFDGAKDKLEKEVQATRVIVVVYDICRARHCDLALCRGRTRNGEWKFEENPLASDFFQSDSPLPILPIRQLQYAMTV